MEAVETAGREHRPQPLATDREGQHAQGGDQLRQRDQHAESHHARGPEKAPAPAIPRHRQPTEGHHAEPGRHRFAAQKRHAARRSAQGEGTATPPHGARHRERPPGAHREDVVEGQRGHHPARARIGQPRQDRRLGPLPQPARQPRHGHRGQQPVERVMQIERAPEGQHEVEGVARVERQGVRIAAERLAQSPCGVGRRDAPLGQGTGPEGLERQVRREHVPEVERLLPEGEGQGEPEPQRQGEPHDRETRDRDRATPPADGPTRGARALGGGR